MTKSDNKPWLTLRALYTTWMPGFSLFFSGFLAGEALMAFHFHASVFGILLLAVPSLAFFVYHEMMK